MPHFSDCAIAIVRHHFHKNRNPTDPNAYRMVPTKTTAIVLTVDELKSEGWLSSFFPWIANKIVNIVFPLPLALRQERPVEEGGNIVITP